MPLPDELLTLAGRLLGPPPPAAVPEADVRRAVSTAYYALFHKLIAAAVDRGVPAPQVRPFAARNLEHRAMVNVCRRYMNAANMDDGPVPGSGSYQARGASKCRGNHLLAPRA